MLFDSDLPLKRKNSPPAQERSPKRPKTYDIDEQLQRELRELYEATDSQLAALETQIPQTNIPKQNHHQSHQGIPEIGPSGAGPLNVATRISNAQEKTAQVDSAAQPAPKGYVAPIPVKLPDPTFVMAPSSPKLDEIIEDPLTLEDPLEPAPLEPAPLEPAVQKPRLQIPPPVKQAPAPKPKPLPKPTPDQFQQAQMMQYYQMQMMQAQMMQNPAYAAQMLQYMKIQQMQRRQMMHQQALLLKQKEEAAKEEQLFEPPNMKGLFKGL